jgi:hypothetical protein
MMLTAPWQCTEFAPDCFLNRAAIDFTDAARTAQKHSTD